MSDSAVAEPEVSRVRAHGDNSPHTSAPPDIATHRQRALKNRFIP